MRDADAGPWRSEPMRSPEQFADPVIVPGPNLRSRHTDTEVVDDAAELPVGSTLTACPGCGVAIDAPALTCPACDVFVLGRAAT
jgi:hypothetical protein